MPGFFKNDIAKINSAKNKYKNLLSENHPEDVYNYLMSQFETIDDEEHEGLNKKSDKYYDDLEILNNGEVNTETGMVKYSKVTDNGVETYERPLAELEESKNTFAYQMQPVKQEAKDKRIAVYLAAKEEYDKTPWYKRLFHIPTWIKEHNQLKQIEQAVRGRYDLSENAFEKLESYCNDSTKADGLLTVEEFYERVPAAKYDAPLVDDNLETFNAMEFVEVSSEPKSTLVSETPIKEENLFINKEERDYIESNDEVVFKEDEYIESTVFDENDDLDFNPEEDILNVGGAKATKIVNGKEVKNNNLDRRAKAFLSQNELNEGLKELFESNINIQTSNKVETISSPTVEKGLNQ